MAENNDSKWDKNFVAAVVVVGAVVTIATPELRKLFCLEKDNPAPQQQTVQTVPQPSPTPAESAAEPKPKPPVVHTAKEPAVPYECTIGDNKSEFVEEANTNLSVKFHNIGGEDTAIVTITPDVKEQIILPTVGSGSKEFSSSTGIFLFHVLNVDWNSRTVTVQVSRKS
ncbi:hypothetical protein VU08_00340 [Desulfobulbus sp. F5]|nr:hypothetical protein [Desulfobulbus sp. F5]